MESTVRRLAAAAAVHSRAGQSRMSSASRVVIVDYGAGNLRSVARAVAHAGVEAVVSTREEDVAAADALIVPGVGAAEDTMANLRAAGLDGPIVEYIASGRPFLGVCMGMQALFEVSEEGGTHECLGVFPGRIVRFPHGLTVPHMGWNTVSATRAHPVLEGIPDGSFFYFVHSYHPAPSDHSVVVAETEYEDVRFPAIVGRDNVIATQFHPEKSGKWGLRVYDNFLRLALERGSIAPDATTAAR
jgi:imidazole glycerol-phosphate synthase subunit HisH